jgi:hypothetical protein
MMIQIDVWSHDPEDGPGKHLRRIFVSYGDLFIKTIKEELEAGNVMDIGKVEQEDVDRELAIAQAVNAGRKGLLS